MSVKRSADSTPSREAKRARFEEQPGRVKGPSPLILVAGIVVVVVLIGGTIFAVARPSPTAASVPEEVQLPAAEGAAGEEPVLVRAATLGHDPYPLVAAEDGAVRLPLSTFDDGKAHHYTFMHLGEPVEFFVLKSQDGVVRAAFNACDVCFQARKGYAQDGDFMVCNNCGRRFPSNQINDVQGGCNPSPLTRTIEDDTLVIQVEDLVRGLEYF